jgi:hypothetical protein
LKAEWHVDEAGIGIPAARSGEARSKRRSRCASASQKKSYANRCPKLECDLKTGAIGRFSLNYKKIVEYLRIAVQQCAE